MPDPSDTTGAIASPPNPATVQEATNKSAGASTADLTTSQDTTNGSAASDTPTPASASRDSVTFMNAFTSTDLSKELLMKLQTEIKNYKRNKNASGAIFSQSHVAYEAIVGLIEKIKRQNRLESLPWDDFEKSAIGITELERFLLGLLFEDHDHAIILPDSTKLQESVKFVETWVSHHAAAIKRAEALENWVFEKAKLLGKNERATFKHKLQRGQREDHIETLESIDKDVQGNKLAGTDIPREESDKTDYVKDVKAAVTGLSQEVKGMTDKLDYPEEQVGKVVAGVMLLHIPFVVSQLENDAKTSEHIRSVRIWDAAKKFAEYLFGFIEETSDKEDEPSPEKKTELNTRYDVFKKLLLDILDVRGGTPQIFTTMRLSAQVCQPSEGHSVALVEMSYAMNKDVKTKDENDMAMRKALITAIDVATKALAKARDEIMAFDEAKMADKIKEVEDSYVFVCDTRVPLVA
ncbi:hypothetical protein BKA70DRAFT_1254891 [Coprinopsis sp. MPI-PUGE-AT-0042]|nr:hypothetical protein BKA70DRAFT_1254891 [Coprinopsis sp. MPI-PUGE-AT-0042]